MKNIIEICKEFGFEIPADKHSDFLKAVNEEYKTVAEVNKIIAKSDEYKVAKETAEETLKSFEGIDPAKINEELNNWKQKAEQAEKDADKRIAERDFTDALNAELDKIKFTSASARKAVENELRAKELKLTDGKILGFNDALEQIRSSDAAAFVDETQDDLEKNRARFTGPNMTGPQKQIGNLGNLSMAEYIAARKKM